MPSPVGHALASTAVGWAVARPARPWRALVVQTAVLAAIGMAPDLDILWGRHSRETHSLGAALVVGVVAAVQRWPIGARSRLGTFLTAVAAYVAHPLMDACAADGAAPFGVMLLWPFSHQFYLSPIAIFDPISRALTTWAAWRHDAIAAVKEIAIFAPLAAAAYLVRRTKSRANP
jgi:inner membrane protein